MNFYSRLSGGGKTRILITSDNVKIYQEIRSAIRQYVDEAYIVDMFQNVKEDVKKAEPMVYTIRGKYSYGPLCNHELVEKVGAFCSFGTGTDVVPNHSVRLISTHTFLYWGGESVYNSIYGKGDCSRHRKQYMHKNEKVIIGNDVWLGKNVIITNGAHIGNGVIAGAGAVITKDVPDYAVVGGVPARVIRYRYSQDQIDKLNAIAWWNWSDEKISECYEDFYEDIEIFIRKHMTNS